MPRCAGEPGTQASQQPGTYPWRWCHKSSVSRAECCQSRARSQPSAGCPMALKAGPFCAAAVCTAAQTQPALPHTPAVMRCWEAGNGVQPTCCSVCGHGSQQIEHCGCTSSADSNNLNCCVAGRLLGTLSSLCAGMMASWTLECCHVSMQRQTHQGHALQHDTSVWHALL